jgi:hypothetical protein
MNRHRPTIDPVAQNVQVGKSAYDIDRIKRADGRAVVRDALLRCVLCSLHRRSS